MTDKSMFIFRGEQLDLPIFLEVACKTCGRLFATPKKRKGRHRRYCSPICRHTAEIGWKRTWRAKNPRPRRPHHSEENDA